MGDNKLECHNDMTFDKLIISFIQENKVTFAVYMLLLLAIPLRDILMPHMIGKLYNKVKNGESFAFIILVISTLIIVIQISYILGDFVETKLHPAMNKFIREKMMAHLFATRTNRYNDLEIGGVISKIIKLPNILYNYVDHIKGMIIPYIITVLFSLIYIAFIDWKLCIPLVVILFIFVLTLSTSFNTCSKSAVLRDENFTMLFADVDDVLRNMITVMSFNKMDAEFERMNKYQKDYSYYTEETLKCSLVSKYIVIPLILLYIVFLCYYCYKQVTSNKMSSGTFVTLLIISFIILNVILITLSSWKDILLRWGIIKHSMNTFEYCDVHREPYDIPARVTTGIHFQDVDFNYITHDSERPVFKNLNLNIRFNEVTLVVGEIGSGKSTLINMMLKYQLPQRGEVFLEGVPFSKINNSEIRRRIIYIPQTPILLNRSVYENITYGLEGRVSKDKVEQLVRDLGLHRFVDGLPHKLDTNVGMHGSKLSGGQRQIVWILKAILLNPDIIIMDEPTASVDEDTKKVIHYLLEKVMIGKTIIMITHDPYLLKFANRVVTIGNNGVMSDEYTKRSESAPNQDPN